MDPRPSVPTPQDSRRSLGVFAAVDATPRSATSRLTAQVRGVALKGEKPEKLEERAERGRGCGWGVGRGRAEVAMRDLSSVQDLTVTRGRQAMFSCTVNFQLPKEEITYSWKFAGGVSRGGSSVKGFRRRFMLL